MSKAAFGLALLATGAVITLTAFIIREVLHVHREASVDLGVLVGAVVFFVILRLRRRAEGRSESKDE